MLSVIGTYDGKTLKLAETVSIKKPTKVLITFLDETSDDISGKEIAVYVNSSASFDFLKEPEEDIYTDADLKKKY